MQIGESVGPVGTEGGSRGPVGTEGGVWETRSGGGLGDPWYGVGSPMVGGDSLGDSDGGWSLGTRSEG